MHPADALNLTARVWDWRIRHYKRMSYLEESLRRDLERIRSRIRLMGQCCLRSLRNALSAFLGGNHQLAYFVILREQNIDVLEKEIDLLCLEFLVRQQPVARPLRYVYGAIKVNGELERIGDYSESIARQVLRLDYNALPFSPELFEEEADLSIQMLSDAISAFVQENEQLARNTIIVEDRIDQIRREVDRNLLEYVRQGKLDVSLLIPLLTISRRFERVSDQAKEICLDTIYVCTGQYEKHQGGEVFRILFVDAHNSGLSQMAEAIGESLGIDRLVFESAGVDPRPVDPRIISFLAEKGIDIASKKSLAIEQVPNLQHYQVLVALDEAGRSAVRSLIGKAVELDWFLEDPTRESGSVEQLRPKLEEAYQFLFSHIRNLVDAIVGDDKEP